MNRLIAFAIVVVLVSLLVVRCSTPAATLRFRMTVDVSTPAGIRRGSSVMELYEYRKFLIPMPGAGGSDWGGGSNVFGEAPYIDLGGETLFVLQHDRHYSHEIKWTVSRTLFAARIAAGAKGDRIYRDLNRERPEAIVAPDDYPAFARFANLRDPQSAEEIEAGKMGAGAFAGMAVSRITIQVVDPREPLTTSLSERFPELARERGLLALYHKY